MRKREEEAIEKRELKEKAFQEIKKGVRIIFMDSLLRPELDNALLMAGSKQDNKQQKQAALFEGMVQTNAALCLDIRPKNSTSAEDQCRLLIDTVDRWPHSRPSLQSAVALYRQDEMPPSLRKWADNPGNPPPQKRGPRKFAQHWKALRDRTIGVAIDWAVTVQQNPWWIVRLPVRRHGLSKRGKKDHSICRAALEVLEEFCTDLPDCHPPTYRMVWNVWRRYKNDVLAIGKLCPERPPLEQIQFSPDHIRRRRSSFRIRLR